MTQLEARRINNIAFLKISVGPRFKSWRAHHSPNQLATLLAPALVCPQRRESTAGRIYFSPIRSVSWC